MHQKKKTNNKLNPKTRKGTEIMKTYIFTKKFYRRNTTGYYEMMDSRIMGVYNDYDKAMAEAESHMNMIRDEFGGVITEKSLFDNEIFDHTLEEGNNKIAFIVTWHKAA